MDKDTIIKEISVVVRRYLAEKDYKIYLFGSWARGDALETSDIDIGILGEKKVDNLILFRIRREVEGIPTLRGIDIVDLSSVEEGFKNNVLSYAKPL